MLYIWVLFFDMYNNVEFTYSVMFSSFSSSYLPPPHLLSIGPLCPACHPILSAAFTTNPLTLYFKSNSQAHDVQASESKTRMASPASPGREPTWQHGPGEQGAARSRVSPIPAAGVCFSFKSETAFFLASKKKKKRTY